MKTFTIASLTLVGYNSFTESLSSAKNISFDSSSDDSDILNVLNDLEYYDCSSVDYCREAWEICGGECGSVQLENEPNFEGINCAMDALTIEANAISDQLHRNGWHEAVSEICDNIVHACETAYDLGFEGELRITKGSVFGWATHNRETDEGCAIYDDEKGHNYPRLIEGELYAVEHKITENLYISAAWNPSNENEA